VEEILGPVNKVYFTIKTDTGVNAVSFKLDDKLYIGTDKLLPLARFTNEGKKPGGGRGAGRGAPRGKNSKTFVNAKRTISPTMRRATYLTAYWSRTAFYYTW
jgi:hypothetical protein